jgi:hypothetical protein
MTTKELSSLIRPIAKAECNNLSAKEVIELNSLLDKLESLDTLSINQVVGKMARWTPPSATISRKPSAMSASVRSTVQSLEALYAEVKAWPEPNYDAVRDRVAVICTPLKKLDLVKAAKEFTGRGAASNTPQDLIQLISNPILSRLENRFMFAS